MGEEKLAIGVVGYGVVGKATSLIFKPDWFYDPALGMDKIVKDNGVVFICIGTPFKDGQCYLTPIVENVKRFKDSRLIVIRSSVIPGTARKLASEFGVHIASNPEFLREASASFDAQHPNRIVIGADNKEDSGLIKALYRKSNIDWGECFGFIETDTVTAELIKYVSNLLGACKVSLANEVYDICQTIGANFEDIRKAISLDPRLGNGFFAVTNKRGWGGRCLPKDMEIFLGWLKDNGMESLVLKSARDANLKYRKLGDES